MIPRATTERSGRPRASGLGTLFLAALYLYSLLLPIAPTRLLAAVDPLAVLEICDGSGDVTRMGADGLPVPAHAPGHEHCQGCLPACGKLPLVLAVALTLPAPRPESRPAPPLAGRALPPATPAHRSPPVRGPPSLV